MKKVIPKKKVKEMDVIFRSPSRREAERNGAICSTGRVNGYRLAFLKGEGASSKDSTWCKGLHEHRCCKSKVAWRHKVSCKLLQFEESC